MNSWKLETDVAAQACGCIGPQNGEPYCPCAMRARRVYQRDGRWIEPEKDLGPVTSSFSKGFNDVT